MDKPAIYQLICRLIAGSLPPTALEGLSLEAWRYLARLTEAEGVAPLAYARLLALGEAARLPDSIRQRLSGAYYNTSAQNSLMLRELGEVLGALAEAEIPAVVLKGASLALTVYPDPGLRPMGDLDLLIAESQVESATRLMLARGYRIQEPEILPGINRELVHAAHLQGGPAGRVELELHWNLIAGAADQRAVPSDWFFAQTAPFILPFSPPPARPYLHLHPAAHLLYLAAHQRLRHGDVPARLLWLYDVDQLIRRFEIDWNSVLEQAGVFGWEQALADVLAQAAHTLETPGLASVLAKLAAGRADFLLPATAASLTRRSRLRSTWTFLRRLRWKTRLLLVLALVFPSPAYLRWRYAPQPAWAWPFFYLVRWWQVSREVVQSLFIRSKPHEPAA